jgi:hypothetical protein
MTPAAFVAARARLNESVVAAIHVGPPHGKSVSRWGEGHVDDHMPGR